VTKPEAKDDIASGEENHGCFFPSIENVAYLLTSADRSDRSDNIYNMNASVVFFMNDAG
jgi:hypothetical protein